ncbi:single-stranded DNA-binding protein [Thermospira aquatica]|uniref:Single-stranded DNA-binding protein n=1 Tax=Thermospira aquatica TaxID=2828656 RepID=A0AAX3BEY1_9SPIR|nr:single-stranded DNA-binding protein [Thermospira aquatica]URA10766.1 single-stranded DNA-binding protein [Thermospira aquatica]
MSWDINRVVLVGRLARDPEIKYTPSNTAVARFTLAVGGKQKNDGTDSVSFLPIVVWGKTAETCKQYLSKGKMVAVDGRLEQRSWKGQDGSPRSTIEIVAERVEFLGGASGPGKTADIRSEVPDMAAAPDFYYDNTETAIDFNPVNPEDPNF